MNRFFMMMLALAGLGLVLGTACKKDEEAKGDEAPKTAEPAEAADTPDEPAADEEKEEEAPAEGEAAAEGDAVSTGIPECDALIASYAKCDKLPQATRDAFATSAKAWKQAVDSGGDAAKTAIATGCKQAAEGAKAAMTAAGCE